MTGSEARPLGLGKAKILRKTDEFSSVFSSGTVQRGQCVDVHWRPNGLAHARLGLIVSRRVARLATRRNRYKRLARETFRLAQWELAGLDVVVRLKAACPPQAFRQELAGLLAACHERCAGQAAGPSGGVTSAQGTGGTD